MINQEHIDEIKSRLTLGYIAGFFDGEGCITVTRDLSLQVCISQNNEEILHAIVQWFGCGSVYPVKNRRGHKQCFNLCWCGKKAASVLLQLRDHLVLKQSRADLAIELAGLTTYKKIGRNVDPENWQSRLELSKQIKDLNDSHWSRRKQTEVTVQ